MSNVYYCGIGSRQTPHDIGTIMIRLGKVMYERGYVLRSGGALGADRAFEMAVPPDGKEIWLPFGVCSPGQYILSEDKVAEAKDIAASVHPAWDSCGDIAKLYHARNVAQVLGADLKSPATFVVYWAQEDGGGKVKGGTATAVNIARRFNIPCHNLLFEKEQKKAWHIINTYEAPKTTLFTEHQPLPGEVFVFGSNLRGAHKKGAALNAYQNYGAVMGQSVGRQGNSFAIPTKDNSYPLETLSLEVISGYVDYFKKYAAENYDTKFFVTRVGCGLAGLLDSQMAPLFKGVLDNCRLPIEWKQYI